MSLSLLAVGCVVSDSHSVEYGEKGPMVSEATLGQIQPGKTSRAELVVLLGEPTRKERIDKDTEMYNYEYVKRTARDTMVLLLLRQDRRSEERNWLRFEIKDGIVQKFWRDSSAE